MDRSNPGRAPESLLSDAYWHFFTSGQTVSQLKNLVLSDRLFPKASTPPSTSPTSTTTPPGASSSTTSASLSNGDLVAAGRSLAWKLFLLNNEPLQANLPPSAAALAEELRVARAKYARLLAEKTKAPDDEGYQGVAPSSGSASGLRMSGSMRNLNLNNPLSLHNDNPWHDWFASIELKKTIAQDVERTFPDIPFFREDDVQNELTNILLMYSLTHPAIGYRQGMHELLAPLYHAVHFDAINEDSKCDPTLKSLCSSKFVGADSWALFDAVMNGVSVWYEWQEPNPRSAGAGKTSQAPLGGHVHLIIPEGQNGIQPYIAPIVKACNKIQNDLLKKCDPALWKAMQNAGIEPQIYGIRWLRMLFTREFPMPDAMKLWDGIFACDPTLELALWVCVAMLIRVRNELISADYNGQLTTLLRYPTPSKPRSSNSVNHACLLLQQALFLQMSPTPASSATIAMENRTALDIPIEVPQPSPSKPRPTIPRHQSTFVQKTPNGEGLSRLGHTRQASTPTTLGLPEMLARGLMERGESLGINKTLYSAVTELKKNIPDLAASLMRSPNTNDGSFPLVDETLVLDRPPWEPRSRLEVEGELSAMKKRDRGLGNSLGWIVDTLLQDESSTDNVEVLKRKRREAVESLSYIRDVLMSDAVELDDERLIGEEEALERKRREKMKAEERKPPPVATVATPLPVSTIDSRTKKITERAFARSPPRLKAQSGVAATIASSQPRAELQQAPPWNHSPSSFSSVNTGVSLPRKPPPTSTGTSRKSGIVKSQDPLGAL